MMRDGVVKPESAHATDLEGELKAAIFEIELLIETTQVSDGPRNSKERTEQQEQHQRVNQYTKIRRALYRSLDALAS